MPHATHRPRPAPIPLPSGIHRAPRHREGVWDQIGRHGVVLESNNVWPSVAHIVAGEPVRGSWWAHPAGRDIFSMTRELTMNPDICVTRLIGGRVTYVHRRLWPALLTVAKSDEPWQTSGLAADARALLADVRRTGFVRVESAIPARGARESTAGSVSRVLEQRLLVTSAERLADSGTVVRGVESWERWALRVRSAAALPSVAAAKRIFEDIASDFAHLGGTRPQLPWTSPA